MSAARARRGALLSFGLLVFSMGGCGEAGPGSDGGAGADMAKAAGDKDMQAEMICGGATGMVCPMGMFCELAVGACTENVPGTCRVIPSTCPGTMSQVCGCDDATYDNDCLRQKASQSASQAGPCP